MRDLAKLSSAVQQNLPAVDFENLVRRGRRRRTRNRVAVVVGTAAVVAAAALAPGAVLDGADSAPVDPAISPTAAPTASVNARRKPDPGRAVIDAKNAELRSFAMSAPNQWSATWTTCPAEACGYAGLVTRAGASVVSEVRPTHIHALTVRARASADSRPEPVVVIGPEALPLAPGDPTWARTELLRLTAAGSAGSTLRYAAPTSAIGPDDTVTDLLVAGELAVLNVRESTLRTLRVPADLTGGRAPVKDGTGRWWILAGELSSDASSKVAWTDDGGRTWSRTTLDADAPGSALTVSPDGRTVLATSWFDGATIEPIAVLRMSRDHGQTWTTVQGHPRYRAGGPIAFDDGTALLLGQNPEIGGGTTLFRIDAEGKIRPVQGAPALQDLGGTGNLVHGPIDGNTVAVSTDRGQTWSTFAPR